MPTTLKICLKKYIISLLLLSWFLGPLYSHGQEYYGIEIHPNNPLEQCMHCFTSFKNKPKEVIFGVTANAYGQLELKTNHRDWFLSLFNHPLDGIAVDVVPKAIFACGEEPLQLGQIRGTLLKPIFTKGIKRMIQQNNEGFYTLYVGDIPAELKGEPLEFNLIFISNRNLCQYYRTFNLQSYAWDLLQMGMYLDSISLNHHPSIESELNGARIKTKMLTFTVPFEKAKSEYSIKDIQPLYDSLQITDYDIKKINIRAYSSIEGDENLNHNLQKNRANSIVTALQSFQEPHIIYEIETSENWVDFLSDIQKTKFKNWGNWSKPRIKQELKDINLTALEPILKQHRKAVVRLELEKKDHYKTSSIKQLIQSFNRALHENELQKAHLLQNSIFDRLKTTEQDPAILEEMQIPKQKKYVSFFNKNSAFRFLVDQRNILIAYEELKALERLDPEDKRVKYNLAALKMRIWLFNWEPIDATAFLKQIRDLTKYGIDKSLVERMMINYHLVASEKAMDEQNYGKKDQSVRYVLDRFTKIKLTDADYLSLAQYLTYYADIEAAKILLAPKMKGLEANEDLLFYYLNLTMVNEPITREADYRIIMLNAIEQNKKRYCKLFEPSNNGGVTFQLLDNEYLRKTYCESCLD